MQFESIVLKNGCTTTNSYDYDNLEKDEIIEVCGEQYQVSASFVVGFLARYVIEGDKKIKLMIWWARPTDHYEFFERVGYYKGLCEEKNYGGSRKFPKKYLHIRDEMLEIIKNNLNYLKHK